MLVFYLLSTILFAEAGQCAAIISCGNLFKEKMETILFFPGQDASDAPIALVVNDKLLTMDTGAFVLKIDGISIFACSSFIDLFIGFIGTIYCFNLAYPKALSKPLTFFQNVFLNLNDGGKMDKTIVSVVTELNRERQKKTNKCRHIFAPNGG